MCSFTAETKELLQLGQWFCHTVPSATAPAQPKDGEEEVGSVLALLGRVTSTKTSQSPYRETCSSVCVQMDLNSVRLTQKRSTAHKQFCGMNREVTLCYCFKNVLVHNTNKLKSIPLSSTSICFPRKKWEKTRNYVKSIFSVSPPLVSQKNQNKLKNIFTADKCYLDILN